MIKAVLIVLCLVVIQVSRAENRDTEASIDSIVLEDSDQLPDPETMSVRTGGLGEEKPADREAQEIADQVKPEVEEKCNKKFDEFKVVSYATQVVAGINYFLKVQVSSDPNEYIHIRVYKDLSSNVSLSGYQLNKALNDPIEYF